MPFADYNARTHWTFALPTTGGRLFSVIASCRLHSLDPWKYLDELLRVLPYWPKERHLELAPKFWAATRARLQADELAAHVGIVTVPPIAA